MSVRSKSPGSRRVVVIGAGIAGAAVAAELVARGFESLTIIEQGPKHRLIGSTGHAPGFVGLLNEVSAMTGLAQASVRKYRSLSEQGVAGFAGIGGLEAATTSAGLHRLEQRAALAELLGLSPRILEPSRAAAMAPELVDPGQCTGAVFYPGDGAARADVITSALRSEAEAKGATFVYGSPVTAIDTRGDCVVGVRMDDQAVSADDIVVACGIWGPAIAALAGQMMPLVPVAHPYVYGPDRSSATPMSPFLRWPEHHVYARNHGDRLGLGTYDHAPVGIAVRDLGLSAEKPWLGKLFDPAIESALSLLPAQSRFDPSFSLNGLFSMTADNLPLLGPCRIGGLWLAEALWVTHAAGAAKVLAEMMVDAPPSIAGLEAMLPDRFAGQELGKLERRALDLYRDIYSSDATEAVP